MPVHVVDCTVLQERNPEFTEPQSFIMGIKFAPGELGADVIFIMLGSKRNFPLLLRDTLALSSKAVHIFGNSLKQRQPMPLLTGLTET